MLTIFIEWLEWRTSDWIKKWNGENSVLQFAYELIVNRTIPFLDVLVSVNDGDEYVTKVYTKTTDFGKCINPQGKCSERYKQGAVRAYLKRTYRVCSSQEDIYLLTWILGVVSNHAKTAPWQSRGLHHFGTFLEFCRWVRWSRMLLLPDAVT